MRLETKKRKPAARKVEDVILFAVGQARFAVAASAVDEIRNMEGLARHEPGYLSKFTKVHYRLVRKNKDPEKTYFVVDAASHFGLGKGRNGRVLVLRGAGAALLVDGIERMAQIAALVELPKAFTGSEREWYRGLAVIGEQVVPVLQPDAVLNKGEVAVLQAELRALTAEKKAATA
ncbi:MAG: chemotaxis protein CheW [Acidobacteriales bacterium]|nr:chemotaxis protein CheW [Terriglobales bacterium]